jgi:pimeloyl-ACP methyl ester carboxylesterase
MEYSMTWFSKAAALLALVTTAPSNACETGLYRTADSRDAVAISRNASGALRYMFIDGRRGAVGDGLLTCTEGALRSAEGASWFQSPLAIVDVKFTSHGTTLSGKLITHPDGPKPLVVMVHGSERTSPRTSFYPFVLAGLGLNVFLYDKRGTGESEGEYTQNFELLADDAAAALNEAKRAAAGHFTKAGFFGGSQGGWVAPLAATRSPADFVVVGFGLMVSPLDEDKQQVLSEMREKGYGEPDLTQAGQVSDAAGQLVASHFASGFEQVASIRKRYSAKPWFSQIEGEFTGGIMRMSESDLHRVGAALFDNLELIWDYDAVANLRKVKAPQLWILAEEDREAPSQASLARLADLRDKGSNISIYSFPATDHGMVEFVEAPDGKRTYTRVTDGYFRLIGDWINGTLGKDYSGARRH